MDRRQLLLAALVTLVVACKRSAPPEGGARPSSPRTPAVSSDASLPGDAADGTDGDTARSAAADAPFDRAAFCQRIRRESAAVRRGCRLPWLTDGFWKGIQLGSCVGSARSRWALALERMPHAHSYDLERVFGLYSLVHGLPGGGDAREQPWATLSREVKAPSNFEMDELGRYNIPRMLAMFDWDGDGDDEIVLVTSTDGHEVGSIDGSAVFSFKDGRVVRYAPAQGLEVNAVRDVDHDGRPDILTPGPYPEQAADLGSGFFGVILAEKLFVAHSLPDGTFSLDDAVAKAAAAKWCPSGSTVDFHEGQQLAPAADRDEEKERRQHVASIICARMRGQSAASITRLIRRACPCLDDPAARREWGRGRECIGSRFHQPYCTDARILLRWAAREPPLRLP